MTYYKVSTYSLKNPNLNYLVTEILLYIWIYFYNHLETKKQQIILFLRSKYITSKAPPPDSLLKTLSWS